MGQVLAAYGALKGTKGKGPENQVKKKKKSNFTGLLEGLEDMDAFRKQSGLGKATTLLRKLRDRR